MTAYNVIDPSKMVTGQPEDVTTILANFNALAGIINGGLDNANFSVTAAIAASKLAGYPADSKKALLGDGSWGSAGSWLTGDTKVSAQAATHPDPAGGTWYLADGSAIPGGETGLIAQLGATFPDGRGRGIVLKGTHSDVDTIGKNEGVALASRRSRHGHGSHTHNDRGETFSLAPGGTPYVLMGNGSNGGPVTQTQVGIAGAPVDTPAFCVVGNLFYHS